MWDFSNYKLSILKEASELYEQLEEIDMCFVDDDCLFELNQEIEKRE